MFFVKNPLSSVVVLTTFLLTTSAFAMEAEINFTDIPPEVRGLTVRRAAYAQCLEDNTSLTMADTLRNFALVCKEWHTPLIDEMKKDMPSWKAWYGVTPENEHIYQQFLNGTLIYRPNPKSDEGMITLKISSLTDPLRGTFDLSECGDTWKYLIISTGYRKGMKSENTDKLEVWLVPRFMIEKKVKSSTSHFKSIMDNWKEETAPIGIFWSWGGWNDLSWYDYLTPQDTPAISAMNLYENWERAATSPFTSTTIRHIGWPGIMTLDSCEFFMFICEPK